jgi:hypothetical protein
MGSGTRLEPTARAWRSDYAGRFPTVSIENLFLYELRWFCRIDTYFRICGLDVCQHDAAGTVLRYRSVRPRRIVSAKQTGYPIHYILNGLFNQNSWELQINLGKCWLLRYALFWNFTQRRVVVPYGLFGPTYRSRLQGGQRRIKIGPIGCPETSVIKLPF